MSLSGYNYKIGHKVYPSKSDPCLIVTHKYKFVTSRNTLYHVNVEQYKNDIYIVKFFPKKYKGSDNKYFILTYEYDARKIIYTCITIALDIYGNDSNASFGFIGAPTLKEKEREKILEETKRFKAYRYFATFFFNPLHFTHITNKNYSTYLLLNNKKTAMNPNYQKKVIDMFEKYYDFDELYS